MYRTVGGDLAGPGRGLAVARALAWKLGLYQSPGIEMRVGGRSLTIETVDRGPSARIPALREVMVSATGDRAPERHARSHLEMALRR